jgi:hypothetical protein
MIDPTERNAIDRLAAMHAARDVVERFTGRLAGLNEQDTHDWSRAIVVEHGLGYETYEALVGYARLAREHRV